MQKEAKIRALFKKAPGKFFEICLCGIDRSNKPQEFLPAMASFTRTVPKKAFTPLLLNKIYQFCEQSITKTTEPEELTLVLNQIVCLPTNLELINKALSWIFEIEKNMKHKGPKREKGLLALKRNAYYSIPPKITTENQAESVMAYLFHLALDLYSKADSKEKLHWEKELCSQIDWIFERQDEDLHKELLMIAAIHPLGIFDPGRSQEGEFFKDYIGNLLDEWDIKFIWAPNHLINDIGFCIIFLIKLEREINTNKIAEACGHLQHFFNISAQVEDSVQKICGRYFFNIVLSLVDKLNEIEVNEKPGDPILFEYNVLNPIHPLLRQGDLMAVARKLIKLPRVDRLEAALVIAIFRFSSICRQSFQGNILPPGLAQCLTFFFDIIDKMTKSTHILYLKKNEELAKWYLSKIRHLIKNPLFKIHNINESLLMIYRNSLINILFGKESLIFENREHIKALIQSMPKFDLETADTGVLWLEQYKKGWNPNRISPKAILFDFLIAIAEFHGQGKVIPISIFQYIENFVSSLTDNLHPFWSELDPASLVEGPSWRYEPENAQIKMLIQYWGCIAPEMQLFALYYIWWRIKMMHSHFSHVINDYLIDLFSKMSIDQKDLKKTHAELTNHLLMMAPIF